MKLYTPILVFIATFILVHGYLNGWIAIPLAVDANKVALTYMPTVYTLTDDQFDKCIYEVEYIGRNIIAVEYWYHWGYDGFEHVDDWEPVVVYINDGRIIAIAHRVHYQWRIKTAGIILDGVRPVIVFAPLWHTPANTYPPTEYTRVDYTCTRSTPPEDIDPSEIYYGEPAPQLWLKNTLLSLSLATVVALTTHVILTMRRML